MRTGNKPFCCSWCLCKDYIRKPRGRIQCKECGNIYTWGGLGEWVLLETGESWEEDEEEEYFYEYPKEISDIFYKAKEMMGGNEDPLLFGPSHIVWEDGNMLDSHIDYCLKADTGDLSDAEIKAVHWSLNELKKIPLTIRNKVWEGQNA